MTDKEKQDDAVAFLHSFIAVMHEWQKKCRELLRDKVNAGESSYAEGHKVLSADLRAIYDKFVRFKSFPGNFTYTYPPSYDPEGEKILEITPKGKDGFLITTDQSTKIPRTRVRYTVMRTNEGLKILDKRERYDEFKNKYVAWDLLL
jgi:hypothetical protein